MRGKTKGRGRRGRPTLATRLGVDATRLIGRLYMYMARGDKPEAIHRFFSRYAVSSVHAQVFRRVEPECGSYSGGCVWFTGNYIVVYPARYGSKGNLALIVGEDDTAHGLRKLFAHPVEVGGGHQSLGKRGISDSDVRWLMGYDWEYWEAGRAAPGDVVRVQGDLTVTILRVYGSLREVAEEWARAIALGRTIRSMINFVGSELPDLELVGTVYTFKRIFLDAALSSGRFGAWRAAQLLQRDRAAWFAGEARNSGIHLDDSDPVNAFLELVVRVTGSALWEYVTARAAETYRAEKGRLLETAWRILRGREAKVHVELDRHRVELVAAPFLWLDYDSWYSPPGDMSWLTHDRRDEKLLTFLVLRPQQNILVEHPEHGSRIVPVPPGKPVLLRFGLLERAAL